MSYGFKTENYDDGSSLEVLHTGDGMSMFTDIIYDDGKVGLGIGYGRGTGVIGATTYYPENTSSTDVGLQWVINFEKVESIESMIDQLNRLKESLVNK